MNMRITVCIDVDEDDVVDVEQAIHEFETKVLVNWDIKNFDTAVDKIPEDSISDID